MAVHPHAQSLDSPQGQPGVERSGNAAGGVLVKLHRLKLCASADDGTADQVGVAAQILGCGVNDKVRPQRQWLLKIGRCKRAVHRENCPVSMGQLGDCRDIHNLEQGIGWRFNPDQLGPGANELGEGHRRELVGVADDDTLGTEDTFKQAIRAPVEVGRGDNFVALMQKRKHRSCRGQSRRESQSRLSSFEGGQASLKCRACRIAAA